MKRGLLDIPVDNYCLSDIGNVRVGFEGLLLKPTKKRKKRCLSFRRSTEYGIHPINI